jgi:hypothetical protein
MTLDGEFRAVLDRFEDDLAVLEVETDDDLRELVVPVAELPERARRVDAVIDVTVSDGELVAASPDRRATRRRKRSAQDRFDRLSRRPPRDDESE